jgi:hypothetical protein
MEILGFKAKLIEAGSGSELAEGVGLDRLTINLSKAEIDGAFTCTD